MSALISLAMAGVKTTLLLAVATGVVLSLRRASARLRALIWATAICGSLLVPVLTVLGPSFEVALPLPAIPSPSTLPTGAVAPELPSSSTGGAIRTALTTPDGAARRTTSRLRPLWPALAIGVWLVGGVVVLARQAFGWGRALGAVRRARRLDDPEWSAALDRARRRTGCRQRIDLLVSPDLAVPATLGLFRPVVLLPRQSRQWVADRRDSVLVHELVHILRGDWVLRTVARLTVALYWFNPLAWWAVRRLELEQELACDETVLALGERATDYASHLLGIARMAGRSPICPIPAAGMARRHDVEERIMAILDRPRIRPATRTTLTAAVLAIAALVPAVAAVQPATRQASTELAQALRDLREVEARLEPHHRRLEEAAAEIEHEAEGLEAAALVDEDALLAVERDMEPYLERIADLEIDMAPYQEQIEEMSRLIDTLELDLERGTVDDIQRQVEAELGPHLATLEQLQLDLKPLHEHLEKLHRELEPLHEHLAEVHEQLAPQHEELERLHERMQPMHEAIQAMHAEMAPLHQELEATARRVERALATDVEAELRERLGAVVVPGAPWSEAAARIVDEGSLHVDDDLVRLHVSRTEVREILTDLMTPHRVGADDAFAAALEDTVREVSSFRIEVR